MARGRKTGGRKKGTPNKSTATAREAFLLCFHKLAPNLEKWIQQTADGWEVVRLAKDGSPVTVIEGANPAKAAELLTRMAEYHYPKKSSTELTGNDGGPVIVQVVKYQEPADG